MLSAFKAAVEAPEPAQAPEEDYVMATAAACGLILFTFVAWHACSAALAMRREAQQRRQLRLAVSAWGWPEARVGGKEPSAGELMRWRAAVAEAGPLMESRSWALPPAHSLSADPRGVEAWVLERLEGVRSWTGIEARAVEGAASPGTSSLAVSGGSGVFVALHPFDMPMFLLNVLAGSKDAGAPVEGLLALGGSRELRDAAARTCACLLARAARDAVQSNWGDETVLLQAAMHICPTPEVLLQAANRTATPPQGPGISRPGSPESVGSADTGQSPASVEVSVDLDSLKARVLAQVLAVFGPNWSSFLIAGHFVPVQAPNGCVLRAFTNWATGRRQLLSDTDPACLDAEDVGAFVDAAECIREAGRRRRAGSGSPQQTMCC